MAAKFWMAVLLAASVCAGTLRAAESDDVEAQLKAARQKLEEAAHQVAELSAQLGKPLVDRLMLMGEGPGHAVIGVQLDSDGTRDGAHVRDVSPGGPAAQAGIRAGDVIVSINGRDVKSDHAAAEVARQLRSAEPDTKVKIRVQRAGRTLDFEVTARAAQNAWSIPGMPPDLRIPFGPGFDAHGGVAGMELATLTPQLGTYFGTAKGVLVLRAPRQAAFNLQDGDVILSIDGREPSSGSHATRILDSYQPGEKIKLALMRQHKKMSVEAVMPEGGHKEGEPMASAAGEAD
jgi:S1-C subfamily serine protease